MNARTGRQQRHNGVVPGRLERLRRTLRWALPATAAGLGLAALARTGRRWTLQKGHRADVAGGPLRPAVPGSSRADQIGRLVFDRVGQGEPLVLLHGLGHSRRSWDPVIDRLAAERDVIAVDLPGHGDSAGQPNGRGWAPADQAITVAELLDELGLDTVHVAGNSTGGWVALELGRRQRARTVTGVSPAGLWRRSGPLQIGTMRPVRLGARIIRQLSPNAPRTRLVRALLTAQASGHPFMVPYEDARTAVHDMAAAPGFRQTLRAAERRSFQDGEAIRVPVTIAFGSRDWALLPVVARRRNELPAHTRWVTLPGVGHIPMLDDPQAVVDLLLEASSSSAAAGAVGPSGEAGGRRDRPPQQA